MKISVSGADKQRAVAALLLLSLLWALDGIGPDLFPALRHSPLPATERQTIQYALLAAVATIYASKRRSKWPNRSCTLIWVGVGLLLFAAPAMLALATQGWVSQLERVAIFSLTPVFAAVLEPHLGNTAPRSNGLLIAALVGVAGALCIFPLNVPGSPGAAGAVLASVVATACAAIGNCIAVRGATSSAEPSLSVGTAVAGGSAALASAMVGICAERAQWQLPLNVMQLLWIIAIDLPALVALFWLLRRMSATRMTTRFLLAPLLTVLAGVVLEQPEITGRMILGIALMAAGAAWLLLAPDVDADAERFEIL